VTVDGVMENDSKIQNEEHFHTATAKRSVLVDATGAAISATNKLPVDAALVYTGDISIDAVEIKDGTSASRAIVSTVGALSVDGTGGTFPVTGTVTATFAGTLGATVYQGTNPWVSSGTFTGTVNATILGGDVEVSNFPSGFTNTVSGTVSVDNFPTGFTNTITGTVSSTILGGTVTSSQGTSPWVTTLVDSSGTAITSTNKLPVDATFTGTLEVHLDKDDDSVTVWQTTAANLKSEVSGTVASTILGGTLSVDNFPSGFTNTISGTVSVDNLLSTVSVDNFPTGFTNTISGTVSSTILGGTLSATILNIPSSINSTITNTINSTSYQGTDPWIVNDQIANSLVPSSYDYISLSYTAGNLDTVIFKLGGTSGTAISTLSLSYDGSDNLTDVVKS